jgi:hypothetical protein
MVEFTIPECTRGRDWLLQIDTNLDEFKTEKFQTGDKYQVSSRSLLLFQLETAGK